MLYTKNKKLSAVEILAIILPLLLIAPNIGLNISDRLGFMEGFINIVTPLTAYMLLMSLWKRTGAMTLIMIPMMCFAAFQIVLLYLYGGSIIGVDMFLNVVTTNMTEINELLGNILIAIGIILILYLPAIAAAIYFIVKRKFLRTEFRHKYFRFSLTAFLISLTITTILSGTTSYSAGKSLFPINIFQNLATAFERTSQLNKYADTSKDFTYKAKPSDDTNSREIYVMVVGETGRAANWQLAGYERQTNPYLSQTNNLFFFPYTLTESNTTHKSVPMLISPLTSKTFNDIGKYKSVITLFKEAGFRTAFFSNQQRNRSYTEFFSCESDTTVYLSDLDVKPIDGNLVDLLKKQLSDSSARKQFIIMHTYGSHFKYNDRYPENFGSFTPDAVTDANKSTRKNLINAFDNTILYADSCLAEVAKIINLPDTYGAMIYATDHGEDIFDDERSRFLHASPIPTYYQLHIPMLVVLSDDIVRDKPEIVKALNNNISKQVSSTASFFNTLVDIAGISTPYLDREKSLASENYTEPSRIFLTDRNDAVTLDDAGIRKQDKAMFSKYGIKY